MKMDKPRPMALVVGALSGAGRDLSRELARRHFDLLLMDTDGSGLFQLRQELQKAAKVHVQLFQGHVERHGHRQELLRVLRTVGAKLDALVFIPHLLDHREEEPGEGARPAVEKGHLALDELLMEGILPAMANEGNGFVLALLPAHLLDKDCPQAGAAAAAGAVLHYQGALGKAWARQGLGFSTGVIGAELSHWLEVPEAGKPCAQNPAAARSLVAGLFARKEHIKVPRWRNLLLPKSGQ